MERCFENCESSDEEDKKSLMSYVLFIVYFGKFITYLLDPGLFRNEFLCRIGIMYNCVSDDVS